MINKSIKKIAVIGCGWLGLPLAKILSANDYKVNGSTTSPHKLNLLKQNGIAPFFIQLGTEEKIDCIQEFLDVDLLIINIPPGRREDGEEIYLSNLQYLKTEILPSSVKKIIFISSTSVYAENGETHNEKSGGLDNSTSALRMLEAEKVFLNLENVATTIVRMAGLIGSERHPGRFFAGKNDIPNGLAPVNLIHLDDCIGIVLKIIEDDLLSEIFNAVAPTHPSKMEFYDLASEKLYGKHADFIAEKGNFKIIDGDKIISKGYKFKYPDLMEWLD